MSYIRIVRTGIYFILNYSELLEYYLIYTINMYTE